MKTGFITQILITFLVFSSQFNHELRPDQLTFELTDLVVYYSFAESINFDAKITPQENISQIKEVYISIMPPGQSSAFELLDWDGSENIHFYYDAASLSVMPFSDIQYQFLIVLNNKSEFYTPIYTFNYADNRFEWHELINDYFEIHWNHADIEIGQIILDISHEGYQSAKRFIPTELSEKVQIYMYNDREDLQSALQLTSQSWVAGHANPETRTILTAISNSNPENKLEMQRQIPHEIAHILTYEISGDKYNEIPLWLTEGLASVSEIFPSPDYERVLMDAANSMELLSIDSLCVSFPFNGQQAYLAYAESASFTKFLYKTYGSEKMQELLAVYMQGIGCLEGFEQVFGKTLAQLEYQWQQEVLGIHSELLVIKNLSPYLLLMAVFIIVPVSPGVARLFSLNKKNKNDMEENS